MKNLFCEDQKCGQGKYCVRRVFGSIGFLVSIALICVGRNHEQLQMLMFLSTTLLGITTIDKFVK